MTSPTDRQAGGSAAGPWVIIAKVLRPHGLRGTFRLKPVVSDVDFLIESPPDQVWIRLDDTLSGPHTVETIKEANDCLHMRLEGISRREQAEAFIHGDLVIPEAELWELPEGAFYGFQLEGFAVVDHASGAVLGTVASVKDGAAHDYLEVQPASGAPPALVPYCDPLVTEVLTDKRVIIVNLPSGLLGPEAPPR